MILLIHFIQQKHEYNVHVMHVPYFFDPNDTISISGVKLQGKVTETKAEDKTCDRTLANVLP